MQGVVKKSDGNYEVVACEQSLLMATRRTFAQMKAKQKLIETCPGQTEYENSETVSADGVTETRSRTRTSVNATVVGYNFLDASDNGRVYCEKAEAQVICN